MKTRRSDSLDHQGAGLADRPDRAGPRRSARVRGWLALTVTGLMACAPAKAQGPGATVRLWPDDAPGATGGAPHDIPEIVPWIPEGTGPFPAIVICPGGGYAGLAPHEGAGYAEWLQARGVAAFALKYRLGTNGYRHPSMLLDAARAVRTVRANAADWSIDPDRVGIMGSSAGGHLASMLLTMSDAGQADADDPVERASSRPDFGVLCYPVIALMPPLGHGGSARNLLGPDPDPAQLEALSTHLRVTADTPPTFLWSLDRDQSVPVGNAAAFANALAGHGVRFEFHVYHGDLHGTGLRNHPIDDTPQHPWGDALLRWLRLQSVLH
jgi:acetyl esterase/lipase